MNNFTKKLTMLENKTGSGLFGTFLPKDIKGEKDLIDAVSYYDGRNFTSLNLFLNQHNAKPGSMAGYKSIKKFTTHDNNFKNIKCELRKKSNTEYMITMLGAGYSRQLAFTIKG